jgi:DnaK suppressor protein
MHIETQQHLTTLRKLLVGRRGEVVAALNALSMRNPPDTAAASGGVSDRKEDAANFQRGQVHAEAQRVEREALRCCESALHRLDLRIYGDCCDCDEPIPLARLLVRPEAQRCADCQAAIERRPHREPARA